MKKIFIISVLFLLFCCPSVFANKDEQIKQIIIKQSILNYPGNCPCPYNLARNGSRCGARSAYSRAGGYSPLCYSSDVTKEMIENYKKSHK